ncbi:MAG: response regulator transcription factor [Candidatus Parcubacteria bacterium]|nr:MAG: response regulator transcription factor [Candidatus Parcubacteria bacterium]
MKILIIEDENAIGRFLKSGLESRAYTVDLALDGQQGSFLARTNSYDLLIVDYHLPKQNGLAVIEEVRREKNTPILMLTVCGDHDRKIEAFKLGADDFLTKPFLLDELLWRVHALLRRPPTWQAEVLKINDLSLDLVQHLAQRHGRTLNLTRKEYCILEYLMRHPNVINSREIIMENVWDMNMDPFSNTLDTHILNLRRKLKNAGGKDLIHTFPGRGYKLASKKL